MAVKSPSRGQERTGQTNVVVFGAGGLAGSAVVREFDSRGYNVYPVFHSQNPKYPHVDITSSLELFEFMAHFPPVDLVVNCAAITNVDFCETAKTAASSVNTFGALNVARWCRRNLGTKLIHLSTNFVDAKDYMEFSCRDGIDSFRPVNFYGQSKMFGDLAVASEFADEYCKRAIVMRTSWLFGPDRNTFVDWIISRIFGFVEEPNGKVPVPVDEFSTPTSSSALARSIAQAYEDGFLGCCDAACCGGVYGEPCFVSKHEFAKCAVDTWKELTGKDEKNRLVPSVRDVVYGSNSAPRPAFSALYHSDSKPYWRKELKTYLKEKLNGNKG